LALSGPVDPYKSHQILLLCNLELSIFYQESAMATTSRPDPRPAVTLPVGRDKHAHYSYRDFFRFNRDQGTIIDWNNTQNLLLSEDFIVGLQTGLEREVGSTLRADKKPRRAGSTA
jgi:hypothetical protein